MVNVAAKSLIFRRRQKSSGKKTDNVQVVDLTQDDPSSQRSAQQVNNVWVTIDNIALTTADRETILHPTAWMNDQILAAGQRLLQQQTGMCGLQLPCLGQICAYKIHTLPSDFVQIVNNGTGH